MPEPKCRRCAQLITSEDTVGFDGDDLFHLDCRRPHDLSDEERALLFAYCWHPAIAACATCGRRYRRQDLYADFLGARPHVCPGCRADVTDSVRAHLFACALVPSEVRGQAVQAREAARQLVKQSRQLSDRADVLMRHAEATLAALRETMRRTMVQIEPPQP